MRRLILTILALAPGLAIADGYLCVVKEAYLISPHGTLRRDSVYETALSKRPSSVNRDRGVITGGPMDNKWATDIRVLDRGSDSSALKILSIRAMDDPYYLRVNVFHDGLDKSFVGHTGSEIFVGTCKAI